MSDATNNPRLYSCPPYRVVLVHGGPGAPGEMAPVARELAQDYGVLEPLQTADSLEGQLDELVSLLKEYADLPVAMVGFSWGALLGFILSARHPELVEKLILISSPPLEERYAQFITEERLGRLSEVDRSEILSLIEQLKASSGKDKDGLFARLGKLLIAADSYCPVEVESDVLEYRYDVYKKVWPQGAELRRRGLSEMAGIIKCPVVVVHGDYDPHPAEGVRAPLSKAVKDFRFVLLENCGHYPWRERLAKDKFFEVLKAEL